MTIDEIRATVDLSAAVRMPSFMPDDRKGLKVEHLCDHMLNCAVHRGALEDAWRHITRTARLLEEKLPTNSTLTGPQRERHLREYEPEAWGALMDARQIKAEIERQIHRLTKDEATASRGYTFITGNA